MIRHPKRRGEWVEMQFMARAAAHGLTVSKPWGESARYDFIVETGGLCQRVQVKSTSYKDGQAYRCTAVYGSGRSPYSASSLDFFAFYILPEDLWYIVPVAELANIRLGVSLSPYNAKNRYFRYLEAWHLLKRRPQNDSGRSPRVDLQACAYTSSPATP